MSNKGIGASIVVKTNTVNLPEKVDQSTFPDFYIDKSHLMSVRGPKNIIRTVCEFAIENHKTVNVYFGSFAEIAATMYKLKTTDALQGIFDEADSNTKIIELLKYANTPDKFCQTANDFGIDLSTRTCRRIIKGEIEPLQNIIQQIVDHGIHAQNSTNIGNASPDNYKFNIEDIKLITNEPAKPFKLKLHDDDKSAIASSVVENFKPIAQKYYLDEDIHPAISVNRDKISITFDVKESN